MKASSKILFALLAIFALTEAHALRWYSPSTGRWFSRDPIGERGGNNVFAFVHNDPLSKIDPNGQMTMSVMAFQQFDCGGAAARFLISMNKAPCDGYYVQHVRLRVMETECPRKTERSPKLFEYWEIWPDMVRMGESTQRSDTFQLFTSYGNKGTQILQGVVKFICAKDIVVSDPLKWPTGPIGDGSDLSSGDLPHSKIKPSWWDSLSSEFEEHSLGSTWDCCCSPRWSKATPSVGGGRRD